VQHLNRRWCSPSDELPDEASTSAVDAGDLLTAVSTAAAVMAALPVLPAPTRGGTLSKMAVKSSEDIQYSTVVHVGDSHQSQSLRVILDTGSSPLLLFVRAMPGSGGLSVWVVVAIFLSAACIMFLFFAGAIWFSGQSTEANRGAKEGFRIHEPGPVDRAMQHN
jgi:hypothetical protein